jgi:hypothetical protein
MKNGKFNTSKCRDKLQKMGVLYIHSPEMLGSSSIVPKKNLKNLKKLKDLTAYGARTAAGK